jgi:pyruvate/2-oxoglutarate dehydrogenase complex dihydrolipoamide dehydrogenase (E3) component
MNSTEKPSSAQALKTTQPEEFDLVVLGGATGATIAAWTFALQGQRVAVIECKYIGESYPNIGRLLSKNILRNTKLASYFRPNNKYGITRDGFTIDFSGVRERNRRMVSHVNEMYLENYRKTGAEFIVGTGQFIAPRTLRVALPDGTTRQVCGTNVIVSTGTRPAMEALPGLAEAQPLTHIKALELEEVPEHLMVIGSCYVGIELSQAMRRFGSRVSVIDNNEPLMSREDEDVCEALRNLLEHEGINVLLKTRIHRVSGKSGDSVSIIIEQNGTEKILHGSHVLVALGRTPNTEGLGLESAGVELTNRGYIKVNEGLQTTAAGVWAIGEVAGSPQFTDISVDDFRVVHDNLTGANHVTTGRQVPFCLFTDPELARVGLSENQAKAKGIPYRLFKVPMETNPRTRTLSETQGFLKALVETDDHVLGFTAFGVGATEIMSAVQIAIIAGMPYTALRDAVLTHPTLTEGTLVEELIPLFSSVASVHKVADATVPRTAA